MTDYPEVVVLLITYERTDVARETIKGIKDRIIYPNLSWHIADDGSNDGHIQKLITEIGPDYAVTVSQTGGHSVGRSMNMGVAEALRRSDIWLHWEDDWVPNFRIELIPCVELLTHNKDIGMIRLGRLSEGLHGNVIKGGDRLWWHLDKTKDLWCWTGHAAVRHRRFHEAYGTYKEGLTPGRTELSYQDAFNSKTGPGVVWPAWARYDICDHIGDGYSYKEAMENRNLTREAAAKEFSDRMDLLKVPA
ncbi:MAG: glycosyltransferase [Dehalococcoidia bacterium]|nr:glycosyltransferase [Dehalococcoidia bacterium]